jgi:hypothetical protein
MVEQPMPTPSRGKGNYVVGRPYLKGGVGNETPKALRGVSKADAPGILNDLNAEASYNDWSNHKASGHLNELHQSLEYLHQGAESRGAAVLKSRVGELADIRSKHGFTLHEDITNGVREIADRLSTMDVSSLPDHAKPHHAAALEAANNFLRTAEPVHTTEDSSNYYSQQKKDAAKTSIMIEPEYRANIYDYPHSRTDEAPVPKNEPLSETASIGSNGEVSMGTAKRQSWLDMMKSTPSGKYALRAQGKLPDYEASRTPEQIAAKAAARKAKNAAKKAGN